MNSTIIIFACIAAMFLATLIPFDKTPQTKRHNKLILLYLLADGFRWVWRKIKR